MSHENYGKTDINGINKTPRHQKHFDEEMFLIVNEKFLQGYTLKMKEKIKKMGF
ncbi:hypothetical protein [uncultured Streptococcus sp.]|uniref:hypothetical protein n=1 Tax=uncultured Streptococcus sp. TaxID=83427 RepID=UPI0025DBFF04|nr:hypothetical protein [uncultured Streptococcus sp.]